jgi:peptide-methionine (S)-S-oxide reductase
MSDFLSSSNNLPGRDTAIATADTHHITGRDTKLETPDNMQEITFSMGCFWGAERKFYETHGIWHTAVGYAGGTTPNPTYEEIGTGKTGHAESVRVVFDPTIITLEAVLKLFWESHNPTQGMAQGNDRGAHYRSIIITNSAAQLAAAKLSKTHFQKALNAANLGQITTEIKDACPFFYAEDYHQQYLSKNPNGYCGLGGTGVICPIGTGAEI